MISIDKLKQACKKYNIKSVAIFGSYIKGDFNKDSDLDLLVRFAKRKSLLEMVRIERELSEYLGIKVDLLTEKSISPYIMKVIQKELKIIYQ